MRNGTLHCSSTPCRLAHKSGLCSCKVDVCTLLSVCYACSRFALPEYVADVNLWRYIMSTLRLTQAFFLPVFYA